MKRQLVVALTLVFLGVFSMPLIASAGNFGAANASAAAKKANILAKAKKSHEKSNALRETVDKEMKERLKLIKQNQQGNLGPVAN